MALDSTNSSAISSSQAILIAAFTYLLLSISAQLLNSIFGWFEISLKSPNWLLFATASSLVIAYGYCFFLSQDYAKRQFKPLINYNFKWLLTALIIGGTLATAVHFVNLELSFTNDTELLRQQSLKLLFHSGVITAIIALFIFVVLAPIFEEYLFRGLLFDSFKPQYGAFFAGLISSAIFVGFHLFEYWGHWLAISAISVLAIFLAILRHNSQSITHSMVCHAAYNLTIIGFGAYF